MVKARVGHSNFKKGLIERECKCKLYGIKDKHFLIASHKPWSQSNSEERLGLDNGFIHCPNHESLFDKGFINFDGNGKIIISRQIDDETKVFLNITEGVQIKVNDGQSRYLEWNKYNVFERNLGR